jgi:1,4-alpha-glucan branching enzyme
MVTQQATAEARAVVFRFDARRRPGTRRVALVSSFNGWDADVHPLTRGPDGVWSVAVRLPPGAYPYLFLVDGYPHNDPDDDGRVPCEWGGYYSLRVVR